ncbi:MAG: ATP-binding protein [Proteobacteria bacterium]|nr:ATP-binding protein [Pseudomonadota bacterium]
MASRDVLNDCDVVLKILSVLNVSRPVALAAISQKTGVKLADIIRFSRRLEAEKIIERTTDNGNTFYVLKIEDYRDKIESMFERPAAPEPQQPAASLSSREAILQRRSKRAALAASAELQRVSSETNKRTTPERISAVDLLALKRSSGSYPRIFNNTVPSRVSGLNPAQTTIGCSSPLLPTQFRSSDSFKSVVRSSGSYKAVFVNRPAAKGSQSSRSSFTGMAPAGFEPMPFERSDTNFKQSSDIIPAVRGSIIPYRAMAQNKPDITEADIRNKLALSMDFPLITLLSPRPSHALWASCSALANVGGGVLVLGMKRYERDDDVTYYIKSVNNPEESIKTLLRAFNDRTIISDCPRDPNFIEIVEFGRKKVLVVHIDPEQLSSAPLYTSRDSFYSRDNSGCYTYRNGEVVHCTEEEVKALWIAKRFAQEEPDWDQNGVLIPVEMERRKKLNLPPILDDAVRPLSRKVSTYGQPLPQQHIPYAMRVSENARHYGKTVEPVQNQPEAIIPEEDKYGESSLAALIQEGTTERVPRRAAALGSAPAEDTGTSLQKLLIAEDIRISPQSGASKSKDVSKSKAEESVQPVLNPSDTTDDRGEVPPVLAGFDRSLLDEIAAPAIDHPRLPAVRLCEVSASILQEVRLSSAELADILHRKLPVVRDKIIPQLKQRSDFHQLDNTYYISSAK